jgi:plastocyanin
MRRNLVGDAKRLPPAVLIIAILLATSLAAGAADITGRVTVLSKEGEQPLKRFDHAVVFIEGLETPPPGEPAVMDQTNKEFVPRLLPVVKGQEIRILNSDKVQHNVFSPHEQEPFDLGLYAAGDTKSVRLQALKRHKVYCQIHKSMVADIFVLPNRYFGVTDGNGRYRIDAPPEGDYVLRVWHIFGGADQIPIRVGQQTLTVDFTIRSSQTIEEVLDHPGKPGQSYQGTSPQGDAY